MRTLCLLFAALLLGACGSKIDAVQENACASDTPVTYEHAINAWVGRFCTRCHASNLAGSARNGAPPSVNLDTYAAAAAAAEASHRRVENGTMPPDEPKPAATSRETFHCWFAQGAKEK